MKDVLTTQRQTKYCQDIETMFAQCGHATNYELLTELRKTYPSLSATTVHRITARLLSRGAIAIAPPSPDGAMRYDANVSPHDHFMCNKCGMLRDADMKHKVAPIIEASIKDCVLSGRLTISGVCSKCNVVQPKEN
jgi:Fur family peroxide stress response transcriptional regulator